MKKCILCYMNESTSTLLDSMCPHCKSPAPAPKFTDQDALKDLKNSISAITVTLNPKFHKIAPEVVSKKIRHIVKKILRKRTTVPSYFEGWFEYTKQDVIHLHGYCAARPTVRAELSAALRNIGHTLIKPVTDLCEWEVYCKKN